MSDWTGGPATRTVWRELGHELSWAEASIEEAYLRLAAGSAECDAGCRCVGATPDRQPREHGRRR